MENIQGVIVYSDEASMASGSGINGTSLLVIAPQVIEKLEMGLVPQQNKPPAIELFSDQTIFINAPQYHWHIQGVVGVDDGTKQQTVALAWQLYEFDHYIEKENWNFVGGWVMLQKSLGCSNT